MADYPDTFLMRWKKSMGRMMSRTQQRVMNNLGKIYIPLPEDAKDRYRDPKLEMLDAYYENRQYDHKIPWDESRYSDGSFVPTRERKPRINTGFGKMVCMRVASKMFGNANFPKIAFSNDPDTEEYFRWIKKASRIEARILEPTRRALAAGACFVRFYFVDGAIQVEHYLSKYCFPEFDARGELVSVRIQYIYEDQTSKDKDGNFLRRWFRLDLGQFAEIEYDNPPYEANKEPEFQVVENVQHDLGFVQGEWFRTAEKKDTPDGYSLLEDILDFIDELNYNFSQSSTSVQYNQDPQLTLKKMDQEEIDTLIRSAMKAWNLGREGEAEFLESNLNGVTVASELRDKVRLGLQDLCRVVLMDPEKMVASAQSGKALEVLHAPMVELVEELRPYLGHYYQNLMIKIAMVNLILVSRGLPAAVDIPPGWQPQSLMGELEWPPVFAQTMEDLQKKVATVGAATSQNLISRETGTRFIAKDFNIENVEEELQKIAAQPVLNPFGSF